MKITLNNQKHGYRDYDVYGCGKVKRACISFNPKQGDIFNVYMNSGQKRGGVWIGDLFSSLLAVKAYID